MNSWVAFGLYFVVGLALFIGLMLLVRWALIRLLGKQLDQAAQRLTDKRKSHG